jgi:hypothetical protein
MTALFLFTLIFIIANFFEKSDHDRMKEAEKLPSFTKKEAEQYFKETFKSA